VLPERYTVIDMLTRRFALSLGLLCLLLLTSCGIVTAQAVIQSYYSDTSLHTGTIVKLKDNDPSKVEADTTVSTGKMFGVVVNANASPVSLSPSVSAGAPVYVATSGEYSVLVDNQSGPINPGDYITVSSIDGIGRKAVNIDQEVLGKAVTPFHAAGDSIGPVTAKDLNGQTTTLQLGLITVALGVTHNPNAIQIQGGFLPNFVREAGQNVAGKPVSNIRLYVSLLVLLLCALVAGSLLYAGVRSSMIAIGRNPLSKKSIWRGLVQVILVSLIVFLIGLFGVYLLLKV